MPYLRGSLWQVASWRPAALKITVLEQLAELFPFYLKSHFLIFFFLTSVPFPFLSFKLIVLFPFSAHSISLISKFDLFGFALGRDPSPCVSQFSSTITNSPNNHFQGGKVDFCSWFQWFQARVTWCHCFCAYVWAAHHARNMWHKKLPTSRQPEAQRRRNWASYSLQGHAPSDLTWLLKFPNPQWCQLGVLPI